MSRFSLVPISAILDKRLTLRDLSVVAAICAHTDKNGWCYPSQNRLGEMLGISRQAVQKSLRNLKACGYLQVVAQFRGKAQVTNNMRVLMDVIHPEEFQRQITDHTTTEIAPPQPLGVAPPTTTGVAPPTTTGVAPPTTTGVAQTSHLNDPSNVKIAPNGAEAPKASQEPREKDEIWDTLLETCSIPYGTLTRTARGAYNKACKELRMVGASPGSIRERGSLYRQKWPNVSLTPMALVKHWSELQGSEYSPFA